MSRPEKEGAANDTAAAILSEEAFFPLAPLDVLAALTVGDVDCV